MNIPPAGTVPKSDYLLKVITVGESGTGKSCLIRRYVENTFDDSFCPTIGVDFLFKHLTINSKSTKLQIWDTAGQERFRTIQYIYYRGAHGVLLVFDLTDFQSLERVKTWVWEVRKYAPAGIPIYLVGNKCDLQAKRVISKEDGGKIAESFGLQYFESSSKSGENVDKIFQSLASDIVEHRYITLTNDKPIEKIDLKKGEEREISCCSIL
jgi:small GTP-binding protein